MIVEKSLLITKVIKMITISKYNFFDKKKTIVEKSSLTIKVIKIITISKRYFFDNIVLKQQCLFFEILFFKLITKKLLIFTIIKNVNNYSM